MSGGLSERGTLEVRRPQAVVREIETPQPSSILTAIRRQIGQLAKRKLAEEALQESDKRFRTMIEHGADRCAYYQRGERS